jgi:hypothetical protein
MTFNIHALALIAYRQLSFTLLFVKSLGSHIQLVPLTHISGLPCLWSQDEGKAEAFLGLIMGRKLPYKISESAPTSEP